MKSLIANTIVKWFKSFPYFGRFRFKCLYWAYRLTGWHIRHREWDFVLDYLPPLGKWQQVNILDVGCSRNLFCHEIISRGYDLIGLDLENPEFKYPGVNFIQQDIRKYSVGSNQDFVTCISVFEHIENLDENNGQKIALNNMIQSLKVGGRLLLTIPTHEFAQGHPWSGFSYSDIKKLLPNNSEIRDYCERAGQLCLAIERTQ